jgi:hypothetical protein
MEARARKMKKQKRLLIPVAVVLAFAVIEQLNLFNVTFSRYNSATSTDTQVAARTGDLVSTSSIDRPFTRWLPLVKYGETVHHHTYWQANGTRLDAITRTRLFVFGLCSTAQYDAMADKPFVESQKLYARH